MVSYRFSPTLYSTDTLTNYNSEKMVSAINPTRLTTVQIHLLALTAREDSVSY
jgi:hypothetical protein